MASVKTKKPALVPIRTGDVNLDEWIRKVVEIHDVEEGIRGKGVDFKLDEKPTFRQLVSLGLVAPASANGKAYKYQGHNYTGYLPANGNGAVFDYSMSPPPENVIANGGFATNFVEWDYAEIPFFSHAEVWRSGTDDVSTWELSGTTAARFYKDSVGSNGDTFYYWIRFVKNVNGQVIYGPYNATAGTSATAAQDPAYILDTLTSGEGSDLPFISGLVDGVPRLVLNALTYVGDLTVRNAAVQNLSAEKLFVDSGTFAELLVGIGEITNLMIGEVIQSDGYSVSTPGWRLSKTTGLTIRGASGTVILHSGGVNYSAVTGGPPPNATRNAITEYGTNPSGGTDGDLHRNTATNQYWTNISGTWVMVSDVTASNTAAAIAGQGAFATLNQITAGNISTYIAALAVDTLQLAGDAVTIAAAITQTRSTVITNSYSTVASYTEDWGADTSLWPKAVLIHSICQFHANGGHITGYTSLSCTGDTTDRESGTWVEHTWDITSSNMWKFGAPTTRYTTYYLKAKFGGERPGHTVLRRVLAIQGAKA